MIPISLLQLHQHNAARAGMLSELNTVIANRMVETRAREMRALLRSRGVLPPSPDTSDAARVSLV